MNLNNDNLSPAELLERLDTAPHRLEVPMGIAAMGQTSIATLLEVSLNALYSADEHSRRAYATFLAMGAFFSPQHTAQLLSLYDVKVPDVDDGLITTSRSHLADLADSIENLPGILRRNVLKNIKSKAIERSLTLLVERGLVDHYVTTEESQAYYRLHDLAYSYARVQNTERERFQALRACLYYVSLYNEPDVADFNALQPVIDNLIGSANWAEKMNYVPSVYGFALNLFSQGNQFLDYRGYFVQAKQLQEKALKIAEQRDDPMAIAVFKLNLSRLCNTLGQIQESTALASNALGLAQDLHDKRLQRQALTYLGVASGIRSDPEQAVSYFEEAIAIDRELEDKTGEIVCLNNLGTVYRKTGQVAKATACFEEALRLNQQLGDKKLEGRTEAGIHNNLGTICWQSKQFKEAIEHYEQARQILLALGDRPGLCGTLANLGNALDDSGQTEAALETLQHASSLARELGIKVGEADILNSIGAVQYKRKQYRTALDSYLEARAIYVELRIEEKRKIVDYNIEGTRQTLLANEDFDNRILWSQKAVELRKLGDNYRLQNDPQQSLDYYEQALQIHRQLGDVRGEGITLINLGSAHGMMQNYDLALRVFKDAKYLFELFGEQDLAKHAAHCIKLTEKYLPGGKVPSRTLLPKRFVHLLHIFRPRRHE